MNNKKIKSHFKIKNELHVGDLIYDQNVKEGILFILSISPEESPEETVIARIETLELIPNSSNNLVHLSGVISAENIEGDAYPFSAKVTYKIYRNNLNTTPIYTIEEFLGQSPNNPLPDYTVDIDRRDNTPINFIDNVNYNDSCNGKMNYYLTAETNAFTQNPVDGDASIGIMGPITFNAIYYYNI